MVEVLQVVMVMVTETLPSTLGSHQFLEMEMAMKMERSSPAFQKWKYHGPDARGGYDWERMDGRIKDKKAKALRVKVASGRLSWSASQQRWRLLFGGDLKLAVKGVRSPKFSELQLAFYTPRGIHIWRHDLRLGVYTQGKRTASQGHQICISGRGVRTEHAEPWDRALDGTILPRLESSACERIAFVPFDDPLFNQSLIEHPETGTAAAFGGVPMSDLSAAARGALVTQLAHEIDQKLYPDHHSERVGIGRISKPKKPPRAPPTPKEEVAFWPGMDGAPAVMLASPPPPPPPAPMAAAVEYDWRRGARRIAAKSAQLSWSATLNRWRLSWCNIKLASSGGAHPGGAHAAESAPYDELMLLMYTPRGIYMFRHDRKTGIGAQGRITESQGYQVGNSHAPIAFPRCRTPCFPFVSAIRFDLDETRSSPHLLFGAHPKHTHPKHTHTILNDHPPLPPGCRRRPSE